MNAGQNGQKGGQLLSVIARQARVRRKWGPAAPKIAMAAPRSVRGRLFGGENRWLRRRRVRIIDLHIRHSLPKLSYASSGGPRSGQVQIRKLRYSSEIRESYVSSADAEKLPGTVFGDFGPAFVAINTRGVNMTLNPLRPIKLYDLVDDVFLKHDLNIYNFIIEINRQPNEQGLDLEPQQTLNFDCITDGEFSIEPMPSRWTNFLDLESAIEIYTPMYQLLLTDSDFWRACNSLQLDETVALYATTLIKDHKFLGLVNNRHPIISESVLGAAHRLMLHGLAVELLHAYLVKRKRLQPAPAAIPAT
jgi:hypothetical protein